MKTQTKKEQKLKIPKKKSPRDVTINPELNGKYDDQPLFQDKVNRANYILKTFGIPKFGNTD
ncbi:MAG: hypothetical protein M3Z56_09120 [Bacteroidota bacterium]|nr:hypothetical protein [Bacteroidota bacterium]